MIDINITRFAHLSPAWNQLEIVERKGTGHPDTLCDALAEELSLSLCRYYREHFGQIYHHNVDKALLWGGVADTAFGGGVVQQPMEFFLAGRATCEIEGKKIPVNDLLQESSRLWLQAHMHALDATRHVKLHTMIRPGSHELVDLYQRQRQAGIAMANDTSCGLGFAPLTELEHLVLKIEQYLNSPEIKQAHPEIGEDIKIMGIRDGDIMSLTIACAFIDRYVVNFNDYQEKKNQVALMARDAARHLCNREVAVSLNTADGDSKEAIYLTVTGTSAEAGDDGEVGRGNRFNGLITPYRPMNMEAVAGKNPVTHVGKLYNIVAQQIADQIVSRYPVVQQVQCYLVSRIGRPVTEPQLAELRVELAEDTDIRTLTADLQQTAAQQLESIDKLQDLLLDGAIRVY